jgi:TonB-dependent SusC/RagA subfamily outer membrane receptor
MPNPGRSRLRNLVPALALAVAGCGAASSADIPEPGPADQGVVAQGGVLTRSQIDRIHATRMDQLFEGRFSGVQVLRVGGEYTLRMRGAEPLLVVDGVPASSSRQLFSMNPRDVDQIEILKDAAASIYGLRGANGAVLITTRTR